MRNITIGLFVLLATLLLTAGVVAGHGNETSNEHDEAPMNGTAAEWGDSMDKHMGMSNEKMGYMMKGMMDNDNMSNMMDRSGSGMGCH